MLSGVLRSPRAVQVNVEIMRAFVRRAAIRSKRLSGTMLSSARTKHRPGGLVLKEPLRVDLVCPGGGQDSLVPTISTFYGIVIQMFWRDHAPPHFHALYAEHEAVVDIRDLSTLRGSLPSRAAALVLEWASLHHGELVENWTLCSQLRPPKPIEPLE